MLFMVITIGLVYARKSSWCCGEMAECPVIHTFACKSRTALRMVMLPFPPALKVNSDS